jgi:hypothetical protein
MFNIVYSIDNTEYRIQNLTFFRGAKIILFLKIINGFSLKESKANQTILHHSFKKRFPDPDYRRFVEWQQKGSVHPHMFLWKVPSLFTTPFRKECL